MAATTEVLARKEFAALAGQIWFADRFVMMAPLTVRKSGSRRVFAFTVVHGGYGEEKFTFWAQIYFGTLDLV